MSEQVRQYFDDLVGLLRVVRGSDAAGREMELDEAVQRAADFIAGRAATGKKVLFIGNGGSAAIASHMATDYCKNGGIRAMAFNDGSMLTCLSNDYGYQHVFEKPVEMFGEEGDVLVAISSSGRSENILRGVKAARSRGCGVVTLSGFDETNELRTMGDLNLYVPQRRYGPVEVLHHALCHAILDTIMAGRPSGCC